MKSPLISVLMSAYNEEKHLKSTIKSILNQTFTDFEFIIINDGSTDGTQQILEDYEKRDKRIKLVVNDKNIGIAKSLNRGIKEAKGKYVAIMDAGDISHSERFKKQFEFLERRSDVYILGTEGYWIDGKKQIIGSWEVPLIVDGTLLYKTGGAIHPSIMIRRELFEKIGLYDVNYKTSLDFDFYMRALKTGFKIANFPEFLICVMERNEGMTFSHLKTAQINQFKIKLKYLPYSFNFWNIIYTTRSLVGYLLPSFLLKRVLRSTRRKKREAR